MITEKQVEHVIIPIPNEYSLTLFPNVIIIVFTLILIIFYIRQSQNLKHQMAETYSTSNTRFSTFSSPNLYRKRSFNRSKSVTSF